MYRLYECDRITGEETLIHSCESLGECIDLKEKLIKESISNGERHSKDGRLLKTYLVAGEEGTPYLHLLL